MGAKTPTQTYKLKLADFHRYLRDKHAEMQACAAKVRAIQERFTAIFTVELAAWQKVFGYCFTEVADKRAQMPAPFARVIDVAEQEERERLTREIAELDAEVTDKRARMDALLAEAQQATGTLRATNPKVNAREERLKALVVRYQDEYAQAFEAIDKLQEGFFGELAHWGEIRRLKKVQRTAKRNQAEALAKLREVRQKWLARVEEAGDVQAKLREEWQALGVRVSEAEAARERRALNYADLAIEAALTRVLQELDTPPNVPGELGQKLIELVTRNEIRDAYQEGLKAASEAVGMADGIGKGMERFHESVRKVLAQQRQYNLRPVTIVLPQSVAVLNETWRTLTNKIDNVEYYAKHPREFVRLEEQYIRKPLTDENIKGLFETMGEALNRGTKVWK